MQQEDQGRLETAKWSPERAAPPPERVEEVFTELGQLPENAAAEDYQRAGEIFKKLTTLYSSFEDRALDFMIRIAGKDRTYLGESLATMDSERAWQLREQLIGEKLGHMVLRGLAGLDNERSWEMRRRIIAGTEDRSAYVLSLIGLGSEESIAMRRELIPHSKEKGYFGFIPWSLAGLDGTEAWKLRDELDAMMTDMLAQDRQYLGRGLCALDSDRAWALRKHLLEVDKVPGGWILESLAGLDSPRAWEMREDCVSKGSGMDYVALGLAGLDNAKAWDMRERMLAYKPKPPAWGLSHNYYCQSLSGCDSERAWAERERMQSGGSRPMLNFALPGVYGDWVIAAVKAAGAGKSWEADPK